MINSCTYQQDRDHLDPYQQDSDHLDLHHSACWWAFWCRTGTCLRQKALQYRVDVDFHLQISLQISFEAPPRSGSGPIWKAEPGRSGCDEERLGPSLMLCCGWIRFAAKLHRHPWIVRKKVEVSLWLFDIFQRNMVFIFLWVSCGCGSQPTKYGPQ